MRPEPRPYERYRHFKGRDYQVLLIATDAGSGRKSVVYQGLYEPFRIYVRDMEEFLSEVDRGKYPYAQQKERFALLEVREADGTEKGENKDIHIDTAKDKVDPARTVGETGEKKAEKSFPKREKLSEKAEKITLSNTSEGKSIFTRKERPERAEDNSIRMIDPEERRNKAPEHEVHEPEKNAEAEGEADADSAVAPSLTRFLDADTVEKKLEVLFKEKSRLTPKTLMLIELSLGLEVQDGDPEDRYQRIRNNLQTRQRYERHRPG